MPPQNQNLRPGNQEEQSFGPIIAIIIIVTLLIIGGLYALRDVSPRNLLPGGSNLSKDPVVKTLSLQGQADDIDSIRRDLSATSINAISQGLEPLYEEPK